MFKRNKVKNINDNKTFFANDVYFMFFCFLTGVIIGTVYMKIYGVKQMLPNDYFSQKTWLSSFVNAEKYFILIFLLALSLLGKLLIPSVFILKGYLVSKSVSTMIMSYGSGGVFSAIIFLGIELAVYLPFFLAFSQNASSFSGHFFALVFDKNKAIGYSRQKLIGLFVSFCLFSSIIFILSFVVSALISILI